MSVARSIFTVFGCVTLGCAVGAVAGAVVGWLAPELVRANLPQLPESAEPFRISVGLGLLNGLWAGLVIGLVTMLLVTWYEVRELQKP